MNASSPHRERLCRNSTFAESTLGFSLLELMIVVAVSLVLLGMVVPSVFRAVQFVRLQQTAIDYASLQQRARMRAVQDDRFYSVWVQPPAGNAPAIAYVDIYPQNANGTSGTGNPSLGGSYNGGPPADPMITLAGDVQLQSGANAPNTAGLYAAFCAACIAPGSAATIRTTGPGSAFAPTWGPNGLPCIPSPSIGGGGTVCNAAGGPVGYVTYFQSTSNQRWEAVTITPAGRVQLWSYDPANTSWSTH